MSRAHRPYQPKTGAPCACKPGVQRSNCPDCEGTGWRIDFRAIRALPGFQGGGMPGDGDAHVIEPVPNGRAADELPERDFYEGDSPDY